MKGRRQDILRAVEDGMEHVVASFDVHPDHPPRKATLNAAPDLWFLELGYLIFRLWRTRDSDLTRFLVVTERRLHLFCAQRWKRWCFVPERQGPFVGAIAAFSHGKEPSITCWGRQYFFDAQLYDFVLDLANKSQAGSH